MPEDNLKVLPVKDITKMSSEDKRVHKRYNPILPQIPFLMLLIAPVRSGKSVLLMNLIYKMYRNCFEDIIFFSPTVEHDKSVRILYEDEDVEKIFKDLDHIDTMIKAVVEVQNEKHEDDRKHILIVLDDCLGLFKREGYLTNLCSRYRHWKISIIVTTQYFKSVSPIVRNNLTAAIIFRTMNKAELKKIDEEFSGNYPDFLDLYTEATSKKYNFLYLNQERIEAWHNFDTLLWSKDDSFEE